MRTHLALPIPSLPPTHTPSELSAHITHLRNLKEEYIGLLTDDQRELLGMEMESMGDDWFVGLRGEFVKGYFLEVSFGVDSDPQRVGKDRVFRVMWADPGVSW